MDPKKLNKAKKGTEWKIQEDIIKALQLRGWHVEVLHGNLFQSGLPDLYIVHIKYGARFVECKDPKRKGNVFTPAQLRKFPILISNGAGIWILTSAEKHELDKIHGPQNYYTYLSW